MTITVRFGLATDVGRVRSANQDYAGNTHWLYVVADGMGGHQGGEVASELAVEAVLASGAEQTVNGLVATLNEANSAVFSHAQEHEELTGMGTTMTALALLDDDEGERIGVANVGDSRVYLFAEGELDQISDDHNLVANLVRQGQLTPEQAKTHPQRNILTRALGIEPKVLVDAWEVAAVAGDRYVLCSDGLTGEVSDEQIAAVLRRLSDVQEAADELVRLANEAGGHDNTTVMIVEVLDADAEVPSGGRLRGARRAAADIAGFAAVADAPASEPSTAESVEDHIRAIQQRDVAAPEVRPRFGLPGFTWRVIAFVGLLLAIAVVAVFAVGADAGGTYFVGLTDDGEVAIWKGKPGGVLWLDPDIEELTGIQGNELSSEGRALVNDETQFNSIDDARGLVANLRRQIEVVEEPVDPGSTSPSPSFPGSTAVDGTVPDGSTPPAPSDTVRSD